MKHFKITMVFLLILLSSQAFSHPVSFKSSSGVMGYHSRFLSHNQINYSFKHWLAMGVHHIRRPEAGNFQGSFASANFLLKRWNGSGLQANIYGVVGGGLVRETGNSFGAGLALLQFDIENRDYYFLAKQLYLGTLERTDLSQSVIRVGISPYVESYEGLHSWLILEWQRSVFRDGSELSDLTPFLRIFYRNLLFEIGQSFDGITKFNYITHF